MSGPDTFRPLRPAAAGEHDARLGPTAGASSPRRRPALPGSPKLCVEECPWDRQNCPLLAASPYSVCPPSTGEGTLNNDEMMQMAENEDNDGDRA